MVWMLVLKKSSWATFHRWAAQDHAVKPDDPKFISFDALPACDRQTDRQADTPPRTKSRYIIAERGKTH